MFFSADEKIKNFVIKDGNISKLIDSFTNLELYEMMDKESDDDNHEYIDAFEELNIDYTDLSNEDKINNFIFSRKDKLLILEYYLKVWLINEIWENGNSDFHHLLDVLACC